MSPTPPPFELPGVEHMKGRPGAAVINIASISGWTPQLAMSGQYGAAKAALIFDTERWALEFVPWASGQYRLPGFNPGRGQWLGPLPPRQSALFRRLRAPRFSDGPARHRRGGCRCNRVPRIAARPLDQRAQHPRRRSGAAACTARPPAVLGPPPPAGRGIAISTWGWASA